MADWFPGLSLPFGLPIPVNICRAAYASAGWGPPISLRPGNGSGLTVVRYLLVAEVVEMFMLAQSRGWFASDGSNEGEAGEGLSRSSRRSSSSRAAWAAIRLLRYGGDLAERRPERLRQQRRQSRPRA